jgi:RNA polymerase sigma-70 factor (ECF subfamily)
MSEGHPLRDFDGHGIPRRGNEGRVPLAPVEPDFLKVLAAAQTGANWAVTVLFRHFNPTLMRYLRLADPGSYEDLLAEVWMSVTNAIRGFRGDEDDFRAWIYTIARNRLIDLRRKEARQPVAPVPDHELLNRTVAADPGDELTERLHAQTAVDDMVSHLPATQAKVVVLRVVDGLEVEDVARLMGRSPGWVRVNQHRGLSRLGQLMGTRLREDEQ